MLKTSDKVRLCLLEVELEDSNPALRAQFRVFDLCASVAERRAAPRSPVRRDGWFRKMAQFWSYG